MYILCSSGKSSGTLSDSTETSISLRRDTSLPCHSRAAANPRSSSMEGRSRSAIFLTDWKVRSATDFRLSSCDFTSGWSPESVVDSLPISTRSAPSACPTSSCSSREMARLVDAQETERRAISRELHDEVGQALGALLVDIGRLSTTLSGDHPEVKSQLDNLKSVVERTFQSVRNIALLLRPSMLDDLGLAAALEWQGREVSRRSEIEVAVESESVPEDLPDEHKIYIYRLVQEALNNAVRHSGARNAKVVVERLAKSIVVRVTDDGRGFDPGRSRGMGILGMEERVKRLGGALRVESQPGKGATVTAEFPIPLGVNAVSYTHLRA